MLTSALYGTNLVLILFLVPLNPSRLCSIWFWCLLGGGLFVCGGFFVVLFGWLVGLGILVWFGFWGCFFWLVGFWFVLLVSKVLVQEFVFQM